MNKWLLTINKTIFEYNDFDSAVSTLKKAILEHIRNNDAFTNNGVPFSIGAFFSYRYDRGAITDEDIVVDTRLSMLCSAFLWSEKEKSKHAAEKAVNKDIHYYSENKEFGESVSIDINVDSKEIVLDVCHNNETYLKTNAFVFDDDEKEYYFCSKQVVTTSCNKDKLGAEYNLSIHLRKA